MVPSGDNEVIAVVRDVTESKRIEEQMRKLQKVEAVGRLAGGIAHDFNNLLTIINGYSELLLKRLAPEDAMLPPLTAVRDAGRRAAKLVRQLLAFSREQVMRPELLDINSVVVQMQPLVRGLLESDIEVVLEFADSMKLIRADQSQLEQAIMNLVTNARDAMPRGGRLVIRTAVVGVAEPSPAAVGEVKPGSYVQLTVVDDGHGMTESVRAKIFEPFFTTKEVGKGTGLGLSTVDGIVRQSGGFVKVTSSVGHGTAVSILLPEAPQLFVSYFLSIAYNLPLTACGPSDCNHEKIVYSIRLLIRPALPLLPPSANHDQARSAVARRPRRPSVARPSALRPYHARQPFTRSGTGRTVGSEPNAGP